MAFIELAKKIGRALAVTAAIVAAVSFTAAPSTAYAQRGHGGGGGGWHGGGGGWHGGGGGWRGGGGGWRGGGGGWRGGGWGGAGIGFGILGGALAGAAIAISYYGYPYSYG